MSDPRSLTLRHIVNASPADVFAAFLSADALKQWWAPAGYEVVYAEVHARVTGKYRLVMRSLEDSQIISIHGAFQEFIPATKLVFTHRFEEPDGGSLAAVGLTNHHTVVTVELRPHAAGTELVLMQSHIPSGDAEEILTAGWSIILDRLAHYVGRAGGVDTR